MPVPDNTPAPSRRFLPPSSSSAPRSSTASSARKNAVHFSRSAIASSSASPFPRTQRFDTSSRAEKDEIETSFENAGSSPTLPTRRVFTPFALSGRDAIEDLNSSLPNVETEVAGNKVNVSRDDLSDDEDLDADLRHVERASHTELYTPMPKRRKLSKPAQHTSEVIAVSSSPSTASEASSQAGPADMGDLAQQPTSTSEHKAALFLPDINTPQTTSRFKARAMPVASLDEPFAKPTFKPLSRGVHPGREQSALPDAFSPSRRKGKRDYISGGLADTVRNWVLDTATEELHAGSRSEDVVGIKHAEADRSGRSILAVGEDGKRWLLVGQPGRGGTGTMSASVEKIRTSGKIVVRGTSTQWSLPIDVSSDSPGIRVVAHWDVPG